MATDVFTIGNVSSTITAPSNAKASEWVQGYILYYSQTPDPVDVPENATATQTLHAAHVHWMKHVRRKAIQATAKQAGQTAEAAALAAAEAEDWA